MNMDVGGVGVRLCQYADKNKEYYFSYTKTDANFYKKTSQYTNQNVDLYGWYFHIHSHFRHI